MTKQECRAEAIRNKILNGEDYTDDEWSLYLKSIHSNRSGVTRSFLDFPTSKGPNSYEYLVQKASEHFTNESTVLDLGCGDGFLTQMLWKAMGENGSLTGVDLVPEEIEAAKQLVSDPRVTFHAEPAQRLPLQDKSVDLVVSHLVLMLVLPLDPAVKEIIRVLKPGGTALFVIAGERQNDGLLAKFRDHTDHFMRIHFPNFRGIRSGDPRMGNIKGIEDVFGPMISDMTFEDYSILISTTPERAWDRFLSTLHSAILLKKDDSSAYQKSVIDFLTKEARNGAVTIEFPLRLVSFHKR